MYINGLHKCMHRYANIHIWGSANQMQLAMTIYSKHGGKLKPSPAAFGSVQGGPKSTLKCAEI